VSKFKDLMGFFCNHCAIGNLDKDRCKAVQEAFENAPSRRSRVKWEHLGFYLLKNLVKWGEEIHFQKVTLGGLSCSILGELYDFTDPELYSIACETSVVGKALPGKHVLPVLRCLEMYPENSAFLERESIWDIEGNNLVLRIPLRNIRFIKYIGVGVFDRALFGYEVMGSESITGEECFEFMESIRDTIFIDVINTWKVLWYLGVKIPTKDLITECENFDCGNKTTSKDVRESVELWLSESENIEREPVLLCKECLKKIEEGELDISEIL